MRAIKLTKRFPGKGAYFNPGSYLVPEHLTELEARLAVTDGYGERIGDQGEVDALLADFRKACDPASRKGSAPEDKSAGAAPENKQEVGGGAAGSGGGERSEPAGARTLTSRSAKGARSSGK